MRHIIALLLLLISIPVAAEGLSQPTVNLTKAELEALIQAEQAKAVANYIAQTESNKAKTVYDKVNDALTPKSAESSPHDK